MSAENSSSIVQAIPWIVAIVGWGFTHVFSEARERRKESRASLDKIQESILEIERLARSFHTAAEYNSAQAADLMLKIDILERRLHRISILKIDDLTRYIIGLRRSITLHNFDESLFKTQEPMSDILGGVASATFSIGDAIEGQYNSAYPNRFPYFRIGRAARR